MDFVIQVLQPTDLHLLHGVLDCFADAFEDDDNYRAKRASDAYSAELLSKPDFIALAAVQGERVVGALAAYVLQKIESERSEVYIYDLVVLEGFRRRGVATALIEYLKPQARARGAWVIYVQADFDDPPAVALYSKLGLREEVLHFDISVE